MAQGDPGGGGAHVHQVKAGLLVQCGPRGLPGVLWLWRHSSFTSYLTGQADSPSGLLPVGLVCWGPDPRQWAGEGEVESLPGSL